MRRFKKVMLVTAAVGSIGLTGAGAVQAHDAGGDAPDAATDNAQLVKCEQDFTASLITIAPEITLLGDSVTHTNIGNFCTVVAPGQ